MKRGRGIVPRSEEDRAKLRLVAQSSPPPLRGMARVSRVNVQQVARGTDGGAFEGEAIAVYHSADLIRHLGYREAKLLVRFLVPALGLVLGRWYRVEHGCPAKRVKGKDGKVRTVYPSDGLCGRPDPAPGCDLIREAERALGRQLRCDEAIDPAALFASNGALVILIESVGKRPDSRVVLRPYSRVARILRRASAEDERKLKRAGKSAR